MPEVPVYTELKDDQVEAIWQKLISKLKSQLSKSTITTEAILLMIGMRELGWGPQELSKDQKMDLIHVGMCTILVAEGYYQKSHVDEDGWPHFTLTKPLPALDVFAQAFFLRKNLVRYFLNVFEDLAH